MTRNNLRNASWSRAFGNCESSAGYLGELRGSGASSNREARPIRREGAQEVGSEPRLNDIAEPARIECGPGEVGVFVDREEDQAGRSVRAPEFAPLRCTNACL